MTLLYLPSEDNGTSAALSATSAATGLDPRAASSSAKVSRSVLPKAVSLVGLCSWLSVNDARVSVSRLLGCVERNLRHPALAFGASEAGT